MKVYIETLGCPKNFNDSEMAAGILQSEGHLLTQDLKEADAVVVNTCGFINDAKVESISTIFDIADIKKSRDIILIVSGCLSQRYLNELYEEMPEVDAFIGVNDYNKLATILETIKNNKASIEESRRSIKTRGNNLDEESGIEYKFLCSGEDCCYMTQDTDKRLKFKDTEINVFYNYKTRVSLDNKYSRTIKISEGCDNVCAYCVIPEIRGKFRSRYIEDVLEEAHMLSDKGCVELILIAQDVTNYGKDIYGKSMLPELLKRLVEIDNIKWIRLMYCYEDRITDELIDIMKKEDKICNYIDMPIQHMSDNVLQGMKRRSTEKSIKKTIKKLREAIPDIHIRTTLITGFPGETEKDFDLLYDLISEIKFERLGVFAYSKEENTPAGLMKNQIDQEIKEARRDSIMRKQMEISLVNNQDKVGRILKVLVEGEDEEGAYYGRTEYDAPGIDNNVIFTGNNLYPGDMVNVRITDAYDYDLVGIMED